MLKWRRDPRIAEAMVDPSIFIEGIIDSGKVLTFTADEAILHGYCEGKAETVDEVLAKAGVESYRLEEFTPTFIDRIIGFLINPVVSGILIMLIIGGIYFELQSPGIGFPLVVAVLAPSCTLHLFTLKALPSTGSWHFLLLGLSAIRRIFCHSRFLEVPESAE